MTVSVETCKGYGEGAGRDSAKFACDLTLVSAFGPSSSTLHAVALFGGVPFSPWLLSLHRCT